MYDDIIKNAMMELVCQGYEGHRASSKPPEIQEYEGSTVARVECVKCKQKFDIVVSLTVEPEAKPKHYYIPFTIPPGF